MIYKATIHVFMDVEDEANACDCIAEAMRPLLKKYESTSSILDWAHVESYPPSPATEAEIDSMEIEDEAEDAEQAEDAAWDPLQDK